MTTHRERILAMSIGEGATLPGGAKPSKPSAPPGAAKLARAAKRAAGKTFRNGRRIGRSSAWSRDRQLLAEAPAPLSNVSPVQADPRYLPRGSRTVKLVPSASEEVTPMVPP